MNPRVIAFALLTLLAATCSTVSVARASSDFDWPVYPALVHRPVSTANVKAQQAFDEGLTLVYAFNRDEARTRFERAASLDPKLAIAWWGVALAVGPNINFGIDAYRIATARAAVRRALALASGASPEERALIEAIAIRYPANAKASTVPGYRAYRDAMRALHEAYPTDDDVATLYAESVMDVDGWAWNGREPDAPARTIRAALEGVLARDPTHVGANHYYVHLMDSEGVAALALPSAERLSAMRVEPAASHLLHMSGHIYLDVGRFADLERDNRIAVDDDRAYAASIDKKPSDLDYYEHNLEFYIGGGIMLEDRVEEARAIGFAREIGDPAPLLVAAREGRDADILAAPLPANTASLYDRALARYARSIARVSRGDTEGARHELEEYDAAFVGSPRASRARSSVYFDSLRDLMRARIAHALGDDATSVALLRGVLATTESYPPESFPVWYFPVGEWLGWIELERGQVAAAEVAFRDDLKRTPHNARALFGLMQSLSHQGRATEAAAYAGEIVAHWRGPFADLHAARP